MPKLDDSTAGKVNEAESGNTLMDEGTYEMVLISVEAKQGAKGTYWAWTFKVPEDAERYAKRQLWLNTSLSEQAAWRLKEAFAAFGVTPDTDTDDLIGSRVRVVVGTNTIQAGARTGELSNNIKNVLPVDGDSAASNGNGGVF